jgi:hypothetical protein
MHLPKQLSLRFLVLFSPGAALSSSFSSAVVVGVKPEVDNWKKEKKMKM